MVSKRRNTSSNKVYKESIMYASEEEKYRIDEMRKVMHKTKDMRDIYFLYPLQAYWEFC